MVPLLSNPVSPEDVETAYFALYSPGTTTTVPVLLSKIRDDLHEGATKANVEQAIVKLAKKAGGRVEVYRSPVGNIYLTIQPAT